MTTTNPTKNVETQQRTEKPEWGMTCYFEDIKSPGCYILNHVGTLLRVPEDALIPGRSPSIQAVCNQRWMVTKISNNPFTPITEARMNAANLDLNVNF